MATTYRDHGIVLLSRPHRDNDRLYTVYTKEHGKVVLVAAGSRKIQSKMTPHMSAFGVVDVLVAQGKRVERLAGASLETAYRSVGDIMTKSSVAQTFLLSVDALTRAASSDVRVYTLLESFFELLDAVDVGSPTLGRPLFFDAALFVLFDILGFGIELDVCVKCRGAFTEQGNTLNIVRGGIACRRCDDPMGMRVSVSAIKVLRFFRGERLGHVLLLRLPEDVRREVGFIVEVMMNTHVQWKFPAMVYMRQGL